MNKSKIEWTDRVWNPVTGCTKVSAGCKNCYAESMFSRFEKQWGKFEEIKMHQDRLEYPYKVKTPSKFFVNSMSDLFHKDVRFDFIDSVMHVIRENPRHIFQVLTKRPERALEYFATRKNNSIPANLWLGVSVENQMTADYRIPILLKIPVKVRFLSCEPLLGEVDFEKWITIYTDSGGEQVPHHYKSKENSIHWVIAGGESGANARPMDSKWVHSLRDQCKEADIPFFFKQWGEWYPRDYIHGLYPFKTNNFSDRFEEVMYKIGKKSAGRMLDGKEWNEFPDVNSR